MSTGVVSLRLWSILLTADAPCPCPMPACVPLAIKMGQFFGIADLYWLFHISCPPSCSTGRAFVASSITRCRYRIPCTIISRIPISFVSTRRSLWKTGSRWGPFLVVLCPHYPLVIHSFPSFRSLLRLWWYAENCLASNNFNLKNGVVMK